MGTFTWDDIYENTFITMKGLISKENLLAYSDFNKQLTIHMDASDFQLGSVIIQEDKTLAFYS